MSKIKRANPEEETLTRVKGMLLSRTQVKNEIDTLFDQAVPARKKDVAKMDKLLVQAPAAQVQTPNLQKEAVAKNVIAYFEKRAYLTEAQKRYPELLKVGSTETQPQKAPQKKPTGATSVKSILSGGQL